MAAPTFHRLPGFRDFPPADLARRAHIVGAWRRTARLHGFEEYDGPPLEPLELYVEKSGEEIVGQLYNFTDKGGREVALRPEMTPSLARILGERSRGMAKPIRWFSVPQLFRYERQQRGRLREHFQWNVDVVGEAGVAADAEVLSVALDGVRALGLGSGDVRARVSDRRLLTALLTAGLGIEEALLPRVFAVIDKIERLPRAAVLEKLTEAGVGAEAAERVLETARVWPVGDLADAFAGVEAVQEALEPLREYLSLLDAMGLGDFVEVDLTIVRGLAYYTGIVFELFDRGEGLRAICGGGRYDRLLELVGGEPLPAVGFGMGDVVLGELLAERELLPPYAPGVDYWIVSVAEEQRGAGLALARRLRDAGHSVAYALRPQAVRKQFRAAEGAGAGRVVVIGPDEVAEGVVVVRDMATGEERRVAPHDLA